MYRGIVLAVLVVIVATLNVTTTEAQAPACKFILGFAALRDMVGAEKVGACLEDEHYNLENGNAEQHTTGGLLVWRKADNFTAFTDGARSWINGPQGLQSRGNDERFAWERDPVSTGTTAAAPANAAAVRSGAAPAGPVATATPTPTAGRSAPGAAEIATQGAATVGAIYAQSTTTLAALEARFTATSVAMDAEATATIRAINQGASSRSSVAPEATANRVATQEAKSADATIAALEATAGAPLPTWVLPPTGTPRPTSTPFPAIAPVSTPRPTSTPWPSSPSAPQAPLTGPTLVYPGNGGGPTPCKDGTVSNSSGRGTCSGHGGIAR